MRKCIFAFFIMAPTIINARQVDIQGHRGARGMLPENTIPAFIYALDQGVTTLELDVVISKDGKVVVSHEPWLSASICTDPDSVPVTEEDEKNYNIYQMDYDEIKSFDCGSRGNPRFDTQKPMKTYKPLLADVIKAVEWHIKSYTKYEVDYNIELKSSPQGDGKFHPGPEIFSKIVHDVVDRYLPWERIVIQSFDFRILKYWHINYPEARLAALIENVKPPKSNIEELGFKPTVYSPYYKLLSQEKVKAIHDMGIKVIPWTVNDKDDIQKMVSWKVDGIITDYPNRAKELGLTHLPDKTEE